MNKFIDWLKKPETEPATQPEKVDLEVLKEKIIEQLRTVYDPEIPVNIYDLGLIYRIDVNAEGDVEIDMTLTAPGCPVAQTFPATVEAAVGSTLDTRQDDR